MGGSTGLDARANPLTEIRRLPGLRRYFCPPRGDTIRSEVTHLGAEFGIDLDEVRRVIDAADVLVVRFSVTDRRLLVDARTSETEGPLIRVVPPVSSGQERFKALKMMRPRFRSPDRIMTFQWPRHARALEESGLWEHIARRLCALGWSDTAAQCEEALCELIREERGVELSAIEGGDGFKTLWSEKPEDD